MAGFGACRRAGVFAGGSRRGLLPGLPLPDNREYPVPDVIGVDRGEAGREDPADIAVDGAVAVGELGDAQDIGGGEVEAVAVVFDAVEVMRHTPAPAALIDPRDHLLADLDEIERDQDFVDRDQFGAILAIEIGL